MKKSLAILFTLIMFFTINTKSEPASPLKLVRTIPMPGITGRFDRFLVSTSKVIVCLLLPLTTRQSKSG